MSFTDSKREYVNTRMAVHAAQFGEISPSFRSFYTNTVIKKYVFLPFTKCILENSVLF